MKRKVITEEQSEQILREREERALDELRELGFRVGLYEERKYVEPDLLLGERGGWKVGVCYATAHSATGKTKPISAMSAVEALGQAKGWLHYVETHFAPEDRFVIEKGDSPVAVPVRQQVAGDTAETRQRRENTERRVLSFASGNAEIVDAHGDSVDETASASQPATSDREEILI